MTVTRRHAVGARAIPRSSDAPWRAALGALLLTLVLAACSAAQSPAATGGDGIRTSDGGQVTVNVTWPGLAAGPTFTVVLDTHAVDLDGYDLAKLAVLRTDDGREVAPSGWAAPPGGHHRQGTLSFPQTGADGKPTVGPTTRGLELVVRDIAGVPERSFRWAL